MTEAQFKVGDRVRVKKDSPFQQFARGEEFTVTKVNPQYLSGSERDSFWYEGDKRDGGIWQDNLELVTPSVVNGSLEFMKSWVTENLASYEKELTEIPYDSKTYHYTLGIIHSYRDVLQSIDEELEEQK